MSIAKSITDLVGNTPLVRVNSLSNETGAEIIGKVESFNPLSSVKDRLALGMIDAAEKSGDLKPGGTIVEPTSGNTGIGLAFISAARGYKLILTMPDTMSIERRKLAKVLGATIVLTPGAQGMPGAIEEAAKITAETEGAFMPQQFENSANPQVHKDTTAVEIWNDTDGKVDILISSVGTGGTLTGVGEGLKEKNSNIKVIAVEPEESAVLSGEKPGPHRIQGIGAGFIPKVLNRDVIDEVVKINSEIAAKFTRAVAKSDGLLLGISSGAALAAAKEVGSRPENRGKNIVVILPDSGERYLSTWIFGE
jgi:cysteine synthase A